MQKLTTKEPDNKQLEVAIVSVKAVLVDDDYPCVEGISDLDGNIIVDKDSIDDNKELISKGNSKLSACNIENAKGDARSIFCHIYDINLSELFLSMDMDVDESICKIYLSFIEKRCQGMPLQHIIGKQEFMGLTFLVNEDVLIPRRETEELVEEVVSIIGDKKVRLLDLCCGSGAIGISLAKLTGASVLCADISDKALQMTKKKY